MKDKSAVEEVVVNSEDQISVFKGVRPEGMDFKVFKKVQRNLKKATKIYLKGKYSHLSVNYDPKFPKGLGTYRRTAKKVLGRAKYSANLAEN